MNTSDRVILAALTAVVVTLLAGAAVMIFDDDNHMWGRDEGYMGMMRAMGSGNSDAMLARMREVLDDDAYNQMLAHMSEHRDGSAMPYAPGIDGMMHRMMDGMWQQMPADRDNVMPMWPR